MNRQSRNSANMRASQLRWDNMSPDDNYDPSGSCNECDFTCSGEQARRNQYEGRCPECGGKLEVDE